MKRYAIAAALMLIFSPVGYVRRGYTPGQRRVVVSPVGSRDRTLSGKARIRARRATA